jgi:hypothetical protein
MQSCLESTPDRRASSAKSQLKHMNFVQPITVGGSGMVTRTGQGLKDGESEARTRLRIDGLLSKRRLAVAVSAGVRISGDL